MADLFPKEPRAGSPLSEQRVFAALRRLGRAWTVVHSVAWQADRDGRPGDGEADFCVLHPEHGLGVLEVKGGGVRVDPRAPSGWTTIDAAGAVHTIKDPFRQATATKHMLLTLLRGYDPFLPGRVRLWHAVVLPDVRLDGPIGTQPREIVLDARDLDSPQDSLLRTIAHWRATSASSWSALELQRVRDLLAPPLDLRRALVAELDEGLGRLVELTARQYGVLEAMRHNRRLLVRGGAGTGKSLLALERARRIAERGEPVLLTCFNAPLASHLAAVPGLPTTLTTTTFHGLVARVARRLRERVPNDYEDPWWDRVPELFAAARDAGVRYAVVLVDEGQDFRGMWLESLERLIGNEGTVIVMADSHQQLYERDFAVPGSWPIVELDLNCRNTLPIARWVARSASDPDPLAGASGREPVVIRVDEPAKIPASVCSIVERLTGVDGIASSRIVVLTETRERAESLHGRAAGPLVLGPTAIHGVLTETIHRFKGLEADVVVLVLDRPSEPAGTIDRLMYVGASRARALLVVVAAPRAVPRLARSEAAS